MAYAQVTSLSSAASLASSIPNRNQGGMDRGPWHGVEMQAESQNIRWRDDGTAPTASVGMILYAGDAPIIFEGDMFSVELIEVAASAKLNLRFF